MTDLEALAYDENTGNDEIGISIGGYGGNISMDGSILRCRCKRGECYGGNAISSRPKCAVFQDGRGNCRDYDMNCPK